MTVVSTSSNLRVEQGKTWRRIFEWRAPIEGVTYDPDDPATYTLVNVTGYLARFQARTAPGAAGTLISLSQVSGVEVGDTDGRFTVTLTPAQTAALSFRGAFYELEVESPGGEVYRVAKGLLTLDKEVAA